MENLAVITALYHSGSFCNHLLGFRKKITEKLCPLSCVLPEAVGLGQYLRPWRQFFPIWTNLGW